MNNIDPPMHDSDGFSAPLPAARALVAGSIDALIDDMDLYSARALVALPNDANLDYIVCRDPDDTNVARWEPRIEGTGAARFALRLGKARPLIISIPHGKSEQHTMVQGVELFENLSARALIVNGTHRCANTAYSPCSGKTMVCGEKEPYRESDLAHAENTFFQWVHEKLIQNFGDDWLISIHGKSGPGIHVSNGTTRWIPQTAPAARLVLEMEADAALAAEGVLSCNRFPGVNQMTNSLCGTTNLQGRYINNSKNSCLRNPYSGKQRFIHLEQSAIVRAELRSYLQSALDNILP